MYFPSPLEAPRCSSTIVAFAFTPFTFSSSFTTFSAADSRRLPPSRCATCSTSAWRCKANCVMEADVGVASTWSVDLANWMRKFNSLCASSGFLTIRFRPLRRRNGSGSETPMSMALLLHLVHLLSPVSASARFEASGGSSNDLKISSFSAKPPGW